MRKFRCQRSFYLVKRIFFSSSNFWYLKQVVTVDGFIKSDKNNFIPCICPLYLCPLDFDCFFTWPSIPMYLVRSVLKKVSVLFGFACIEKSTTSNDNFILLWCRSVKSYDNSLNIIYMYNACVLDLCSPL